MDEMKSKLLYNTNNNEEKKAPAKTMKITGDERGCCICWPKTTPTWKVEGDYSKDMEEIKLEYYDKTGGESGTIKFAKGNTLQAGEAVAKRTAQEDVVKVEEENYRKISNAAKVTRDIIKTIFYVHGGNNQTDKQRYKEVKKTGVEVKVIDKTGKVLEEGEGADQTTLAKLAEMKFKPAWVCGDFYNNNGTVTEKEINLGSAELLNLESLKNVKIVLTEAPA